MLNDKVWNEWLATVMQNRPKNNRYIDSERGIEIAKIIFNFERDNFNWRRSDEDTFWIDVQMFVKYKLSDDEVLFICKNQGGIENFKQHSEERNAYAEMMRGLEKLRRLQEQTK